MPSSKPYRIDRPAQIDLLASVMRQEIIDSVAALGPCSTARMAEELGVAADALYYHIKLLVRAGLLEEQGTRRTKRRDERVYGLPGRSVFLHYDPEDPVNVELVSRTAASMLRAAERDFRAGFNPEMAAVEGATRNLWAARFKMWLTESELREVNALLERLREISERPRGAGADQLCTLTWALAPVEAQPVHRYSPSTESPTQE